MTVHVSQPWIPLVFFYLELEYNSYLCTNQCLARKDGHGKMREACFFQNDWPSGDVSFVSPVIVVKELLKIDEPLQRFLTTSTSLYAASSLVSSDMRKVFNQLPITGLVKSITMTDQPRYPHRSRLARN